MPEKSVRLAAGPGFYGDSWRPVRASIERGNVQYVCSDHLAELTLAILQKNRQGDPNLGYTQDLVPMLADLLPLAVQRGVRFVLNAGGLNPIAAREALLSLLRKFGLKLKVGVVRGDAVLERLDDLQAAGASLAHMGTGADIATVRERCPRRLQVVEPFQHGITPHDADFELEAEFAQEGKQGLTSRYRVQPARVQHEPDAALHSQGQQIGQHRHEVLRVAQVGVALAVLLQDSQRQLGQVIRADVLHVAPLDAGPDGSPGIPVEARPCRQADRFFGHIMPLFPIAQLSLSSTAYRNGHIPSRLCLLKSHLSSSPLFAVDPPSL